MNKIPTITIAVSAFNEERNIKEFLNSILSQKEEGFILKKILIISDGSTDRTVEIIKKINSKIIVVKDYKERIGKSSRLNEIYQGLTSDILVQSDADVIFSHPYVIRDIIRPLLTEPKVGMCGGHPKPTNGITFVEKAVNCTFNVYDGLRKTLNGGNNSLSADGRLLAFKKELVKKIVVPSDMIANDYYTYFCCLTLGYEYRYVESAVVFFRSPQTLKDHIKQNTRFLAAHIRMTRYFSKDLVYKESYIPFHVLFSKMAVEFLKHPILSSFIFITNFYTRLKAKSVESKLTAKWPMAYTTKVFEKHNL